MASHYVVKVFSSFAMLSRMLVNEYFKEKEGIMLDIDDMAERLTRLEEAAQIAVLRIEPADVLVLRHHGRLSPLAYDRLTEAICKRFPGHELLILEEGITLQAARPESKP